ncbi:chemotaxis protein CheY [Clostridium carboxidivorans P7]|uniref:Stage 0 sporulation protein A homolog n=1 Tax=Clostridium carboxidivorans P7 TaxID=536227 RepID=C6PYQ4_9CLOT|nr:response regulator [Clostridium carboxidivorans]AKN32010.1 chemotaxis protein CheY [Clostridium carboxidivorans P7]EET85635.1 response regulator receiver protein [Clostridium carboxidivorans P7]EFG87852.1 response regulator receiver domain protein [Clostridium carboxidivorans P7]
MEKVKVVIVDDSPFSINVIRDILEDKGFEVVGEAGNLQEVINVVQDTRPQLVTMDMTLPGTDGLECTREIHKIDEKIKVIVISSMMDEEILKKAKQSRVSGYIQKPIDPEELIAQIEKVISSDKIFKELEESYFNTFKEAFSGGVTRFTKTITAFDEDKKSNDVEVSRGISVVIGIIGNFSGRMIIDLSNKSAENMAKVMLRRDPKNQEEILNVMGEFANIIAGNACSMMNRKNKVYGLRVAPPTIFYGESIKISKSKIDTLSVLTHTDFGEILLNVGFKRGDE